MIGCLARAARYCSCAALHWTLTTGRTIGMQAETQIDLQISQPEGKHVVESFVKMSVCLLKAPL